MSDFEYDLVVIGSGPTGQRAEIQGVKLRKRVAIIERKNVVGGVCINTGTIPSKTLREAVLHLSGYRERNVYGSSYTVKQDITMDDLLMCTDHVIRHEIDVTRGQLMRNRVEVIPAETMFVGSNTLRCKAVEGNNIYRDITSTHIISARPCWPSEALSITSSTLHLTIQR